jgi:hypothetical protein
VVDGEAEVWVSGGFGGPVDHDRRRDEARWRDGGDIVAVLAADPVDRRVEVRADVLPISSQSRAHARPRSS